MFTKTEAVIMEIFVSSIDKRFSIKEISEMLGKPYPLIHRSVQSLLKEGFIIRDDKGFISVNYKEHHADLAYIESLRSRKLFMSKNSLSLFVSDVIEKNVSSFFILLIFGSYVEKRNPRDIDVLYICEKDDDVQGLERMLENIANRFTEKFDINVVSAKSAQEMLSRREKLNILNETLNKHLLLFGAESYFRMVTNAR